MASVPQVTGQWLIDRLNWVKGEASKRAAEISTLNGQLISEKARAIAITDPQRRATALSAIDRMVQRQVEVVKVWRTWWGKTQEISTQAINWLRQNGYSTSGLSALPVIPAGLIVVFVAGGILVTANIWILTWNNVTTKQLAEQVKLDDAVFSGKITPAQHQQMSAHLDAQAKAAAPGANPFGTLTEILPWVAAIGALAIFGPALARSFGNRKQEAA